MRNLEREIGTLCRKVARRITEGKTEPVSIDPEKVHEFLGPERFFSEIAERTQEPGVVIGLAWTPMGGDIMFIEATKMAGKKGLTLTGQLGDVMKESAQAALSYVRARAERLGIAPDFFENLDIHMHVPAGAVPKDGPSAGVTIATALASLLTGRPVRHDIAMTGEITLRGKVLPIGGIKEKVLGARRAGIKTIIMPKRNEKDLEDVPESVRQEMRFIFVETIDEVLGTRAAARPRATAVLAAPAAPDGVVNDAARARLMAASEVVPYAKTGGLGDVLGALPRALRRLGIDVSIVLPAYGSIAAERFGLQRTDWTLAVPVAQQTVHAGVLRGRARRRRPGLLHRRAAVLRAAVPLRHGRRALPRQRRALRVLLARRPGPRWSASVRRTSCTATIGRPHWRRCSCVPTRRAIRRWHRVRTLMTIHNLGYQGLFWHFDWHLLNLDWRYFTPDRPRVLRQDQLPQGRHRVRRRHHHREPDVCPRDPDTGVRLRSRRRAGAAAARPQRHLERRRLRRVEPGARRRHRRAIHGDDRSGKARVQSRPAGDDAAARRSAGAGDRHRVAARGSEGAGSHRRDRAAAAAQARAAGRPRQWRGAL